MAKSLINSTIQIKCLKNISKSYLGELTGLLAERAPVMCDLPFSACVLLTKSLHDANFDSRA
jgi:hypothetical protein